MRRTTSHVTSTAPPAETPHRLGADRMPAQRALRLKSLSSPGEDRVRTRLACSSPPDLGRPSATQLLRLQLALSLQINVPACTKRNPNSEQAGQCKNRRGERRCAIGNTEALSDVHLPGHGEAGLPEHVLQVTIRMKLKTRAQRSLRSTTRCVHCASMCSAGQSRQGAFDNAQTRTNTRPLQITRVSCEGERCVPRLRQIACEVRSYGADSFVVSVRSHQRHTQKLLTRARAPDRIQDVFYAQTRQPCLPVYEKNQYSLQVRRPKARGLATAICAESGPVCCECDRDIEEHTCNM